MMGGEITVESEYGNGSRFTIRVPAYIEDSTRQPDAAPAHKSEAA
jgi:signal transduction histidine kinase